MDTKERNRNYFSVCGAFTACRQTATQTDACGWSRRRFIASTMALPAVLALPACTRTRAEPAKVSRVFFTAVEQRFIMAATARLIPGDAKDPGAVEAGVPFFIDLQLAGPYGRADRWYMQGPWAAGAEQQGYQISKTPAQLYRSAIGNIDAHCRRAYGAPFADMPIEEQEAVLHGLEDGKIELPDVPAKAFFAILWQNTQEGFLSDPMYGGNRDFAGWKLIGFPGPRYNYVREISQYGQPYDLPPVGLLGRDGRRLPA